MIKDIGVLPLISLIAYIIGFSIGEDQWKDGIVMCLVTITYFLGFGPLPWTVNAEIYPAEARSLGSSIAFAFNWLCAFLVTKFEPDIEAALGASSAYFIFASICALGTLFVIFILPETKGKTPQELKAQFEGKKT